MFKKIPGNAFNFKSIKTTFYLNKANVKLISEAWSIFAISNKTIERSNKIIWYFYFFWNSNWKEIARPWEKAKKETLKTKTNRRRKWIDWNNFNSYTPQSFQNMMSRSSRPEVFCKKGDLRNFTKFTENHLCQSLFFNKVAGVRPATLLKNRLWHRCFPVNFVKFLRTPFFIELLWWLLLDRSKLHTNPIIPKYSECSIIQTRGWERLWW